MKRTAGILLAALTLCAALPGCGAGGGGRAAAFTAENEIFTYQRIDPDKTQIVVSRTGNIPVQQCCRAFEEQNPDIQVLYLDITGGSDGYKPLIDWMTKGYRPDVVFSGSSFFERELTVDYFENLSADPVVQSYEAAALQRVAVDGEIYSLPGPSNISAMMYNKTLFERYGWQTPQTFDQFVALCGQITADTNGEVEPWNPNAKYDMELQTAMEAFCYGELFGGADNRAWYQDFTAGRAAFAGHMEPYMEAVQTLAEQGILRQEHFTYSATARGKEFAAGKIAMINGNIYDADSQAFDFGYFPFPSTTGDAGYLCDSYSCHVGLPVKEHTEAEADAIDRFLRFFSSPEGQSAYIGNSMMVSNVKGVPLNQSDDLAALQPAIAAGHLFAFLNFASTEGRSRIFSLQRSAMDIAAGTKTPETCIAEVDARPYAEAGSQSQPQERTLASVPEDLTILETSAYMADLYREAAGADIGLIANNAAYRGNMMKLFAGEITDKMVPVLKPRSFANDSTLMKASMTGRQLLDALNAPVGNDGTADCVYAVSGLLCTAAPWNALGEKVVSVTLEDGSALEEDGVYTVAFWDGTVGESFLTGTPESIPGTWEELMTAKLTRDGTVAPADDGRMTLIWE